MAKYPNKLHTPLSLTKRSMLLLLVLVVVLPAAAQSVLSDLKPQFSPEKSTAVTCKPATFFRGAWIATVANIDWPTEKSVAAAEAQKKEMIFILDSLKSIGINAIVFQVRPTADALYISGMEPPSHWLTGTQDSFPHYDPLMFVCWEAHKRKMEVHAWLNPFRMTLKGTSTSQLADNHIFRAHPEWFWKYDNQWLFNPALPETRDWICGVIEDIVCRYPVDAIHLDDYFYPYPAANAKIPDAADFKRDPRGFTDIKDWRRDNVNLTVEAISNTIRATNPHVQFGIAPFGIWRNMSVDSTGSATRGLSNYDDLYADILLWIRRGWIDYVVPQLYWEIGKSNVDYEVLARWWAEQVKGTRCRLYIGMASYKLGAENQPAAWRKGNEIVRQMHLNRTIPEITGECFYSTRPLLKNPLHVCDSIKNIYQNESPYLHRTEEQVKTLP
ncbi:MAG: family 10 glycosylhydrolase [Paludibacteraceae bacterium]|nr:family 10 glycosylhydrolase [Paludibacteraceae bacterium]